MPITLEDLGVIWQRLSWCYYFLWPIRYKKIVLIYLKIKKRFREKKENNKNIKYTKEFSHEMWNILMIWDVVDLLVLTKVVRYNVYGPVNHLYDVKVSYCWHITTWVWKNSKMLQTFFPKICQVSSFSHLLIAQNMYSIRPRRLVNSMKIF